ncbi:tellurite resistance TerB family protein, partial [Mesorhizobium sp. M2D.F.Ca.ET.140.01.1.1]
TRAERGYLDLLAGRLGLPDALVDHVEATVSAAKVPAGTSPNPRW